MWFVSARPTIHCQSLARASVSACCLLVALGTTAIRANASQAAVSEAGYWAAPVDEAPAFAADSASNTASQSDVTFVAQGWRWSPGTNAWIAVLVRVDSLRAIAFARIGGLYGP